MVEILDDRCHLLVDVSNEEEGCAHDRPDWVHYSQHPLALEMPYQAMIPAVRILSTVRVEICWSIR